jgi:F-type H+-transporting ATPase subunit gamma
MASLQSLRRKISSVKNTQKITKAMKMVAAAKLKRAQDRILSARPYAIRMRQVLEMVSHRVSPSVHPLFRRHSGNRVLVTVVTSDRGLCGGFNANVLRRAIEVLEEHKARGAEVSVSVIGRKGLDYFNRRSWPVRHKWPGVFDRLTYEHAKDIGQELIDDYTNESFDELYVVHNEFKSVMQQEIRVRKGLPIDLTEGTEPPDTAGGHYLYEPSEDEIFSGLEEVMYILTYRVLLESAAAEQAARMTAMDGATRNAGELIQKLTLFYNKTRQAAITKELMDIVGGAEALK